MNPCKIRCRCTLVTHRILNPDAVARAAGDGVAVEEGPGLALEAHVGPRVVGDAVPLEHPHALAV